MTAAPTPKRSVAGLAARERAVPRPPALTFDDVYETHAPFVWRSVCRLGVPAHAADDVVQEIFLVVHRRLADFEPRGAVRSWLYAIVIHVVRQHRRTQRRKNAPQEASGVDPDTLVDSHARSPHDEALRRDAVLQLYSVLEAMNDERRDAFVLAELEQLTAPEIAEALGVNVNTVYWRLRVARQEFEAILQRQQLARARRER